MPEDESHRGKDGTVGKALDVLDQVAAYGRPVRFTDVLSDSSYPKGTLYRLIQVLRSQGMLDYDPQSQTYRLGGRLVRLAHAAWQQFSLAPLARPYLDHISTETGLTVHLAQLDHGQVLYVDKRTPRAQVEMFSQAGKVGPAYCTGVGKAMLAYLGVEEADHVIRLQSFHRHTAGTLTNADALVRELADIRTQGVSFDREEHEPGIICAAVPILDASEHVLGAVSVTGTTHHTTLTALEAHVPLLKSSAAAIAAEAKNWRFPSQSDTASRGEPCQELH